MFGRRRLLPGINSPVPPLRAAAERAAMNAPIQGTAADIIKIAMINSTKKLIDHQLDKSTHLLLQIHDELIFEVEEAAIQAAAAVVKPEMENVLKSDIVPLVVHEKTGKTWADF